MKLRPQKRRYDMPYWHNKLFEEIEQSSYSRVVRTLETIQERIEVAKAIMDKPEVLQ